MNFVKYFFILFMAFPLISCHNEKTSIDKNDIRSQIINQNVELLVKSSNQLSFRILKNLNKGQFASKNLIFSPISAEIMLLMLQNGATEGTFKNLEKLTTLDSSELIEANKQIAPFISYLQNSDDKVRLSIKNSLWINRDLTTKVNENFLDIMQNNYKTYVKILPFSSQKTVEEINQWTSKTTDNNIRKIINQLNINDFLVLINTVLFKGSWYNEFDKSQTKLRSFFISPNDTITVPTMYGKISSMNLFCDIANEFYGFELFYGHKNYSMIILMPDNSTGGVDALVNKLNINKWNSLIASFKPTEENIDFYMPKFSLKSTIALDQVLKGLGCKRIFNQNNAGLKKISQQAFVDNIIQKAYVKIDEKGSIAAAATATTIGLSAALPNEFHVNKPFIFAIRERKTGLILFLGIMRNPTVN